MTTWEQARSCLYASTEVRTHHFPLGLWPTPNWGLNYDPLPYFAYTSFPGWLRPCIRYVCSLCLTHCLYFGVWEAAVCCWLPYLRIKIIEGSNSILKTIHMHVPFYKELFGKKININFKSLDNIYLVFQYFGLYIFRSQF